MGFTSKNTADDHEELILRRCRRTGLQAAIAVHSTVAGPAAGGCRRWCYDSEQAGIDDVRRLSAGMTYKNALAEIPFGGGKSVIFADAQRLPSAAQLKVFAGWLNELSGRYVTAEDVGMGVAQIRSLAEHSPYVSGTGKGGIGGDPSPKTAYGVFLGLKTAVQLQLDREHLYGVKVAVQGLGAVGTSLCHWLARAGAELQVADLDPRRVMCMVKKYDATAVSVSEIPFVEADVFAPCAMGGVLDETFLRRSQVKVVAGAANNQLANDSVATQLADKGVLYAPDFVINAGGVVSVAHEYLLGRGDFPSDHDAQSWVDERIDGIRTRLTDIIACAESENLSTDHVAKRMASELLVSPQLTAAA
ncbi:MAG: leucine dehydrogenase [Candidatus Azotimanducaceae bacterium]|jgi:leucine dehydrogenase